MHRTHQLALGIVGLMLVFGVGLSWGGPPNNDVSDAQGNTAGGTNALVNNAIGSRNTAFGLDALFSNTSGSNNTATGVEALHSNTTGFFNTAIGVRALSSNTTGDSNTATGRKALSNNTTGHDNTAHGVEALFSNTSGIFNTAHGSGALFSNTTGNFNTASGLNALGYNTIGGFNTASGVAALASNTNGSSNTASGGQALFSNITGGGNTATGRKALSNTTTGSNNTAVGFGAGSTLTSGDNNIYLGNLGTTTESNTMRLGDVQTSTFIAGIAGVTVINAAPVLIDASTGQLGTQLSSLRYKRAVQPMGAHSQGLYHLRPVVFRYKHDAQGARQYGLIAEEVAKVYPELVTRNAQGQVEAIRYQELTPMLLNEVQRQQRQLGAQARELADLKVQNARLQQQIQERDAAIAARLERLEAAAARAGTLASR